MIDKKKGGVMSWIPFVFVLLIGGIMLAIVAGITLGSEAGFEQLFTGRTVSAEEQLVFTVSSSTGMQTATTVLSTDYEGGMGQYQGRRVSEILSEFAHCERRPEEMNCGENYPDSTDVTQILDHQIQWLVEEKGILDEEYFVRVRREDEDILRMSRGEKIDVVYSSSEDMHVPRFSESTTKSITPLYNGLREKTYIEFQFPVGGLEAEVKTGGKE